MGLHAAPYTAGRSLVNSAGITTAVTRTAASAVSADELQALYNSCVAPVKCEAGSYPGQISSQEILSAYTIAYNNAKTVIDNVSATDADREAAYSALNTAKSNLENGKIAITDGYYYIVSAYNGDAWRDFFNDHNTSMRIATDNLTDAKRKESQFMWKLEKQSDGNWSVQAAHGGCYMYQCKNVSGWDFARLSESFKVAQVITPIPDSRNGQYSIGSSASPGFYYYVDRNDGNLLRHAGDAKLTTGSNAAWYLEPVDPLTAFLAINDYTTDDIVYGNLPSMISDGDAASNYKTIMQQAIDMNTAGTATAAERSEMAKKCETALEAARAKAVSIAEGNYVIRSYGKDYVMSYGTTDTGVKQLVKLKREGSLPAAAIWNISTSDDGNYKIYNTDASAYISQPASLTGWSAGVMSDSYEVSQVLTPLAFNGEYKIRASSAPYGFGYEIMPTEGWLYSIFIGVEALTSFTPNDVLHSTMSWTLIPYSTLSDREDNTAKLSTAGEQYISLQRTFKHGQWNTVCLPFDVSPSDMAAVFGTGYDLRSLSSVRKGDDGLHLVFDKVSELKAGVPYLLYPASATDIVNPNFDATFLSPTPLTTVGKDADGNELIDFTGVYNPASLTGGDKSTLFLTGGKLVSPSKTADMPGFRAYFSVKSSDGSSREYKIDMEGLVNAVTSVSIDNDAESKAFTIEGIEAGEGYKGIVIKNGRKYIRK